VADDESSAVGWFALDELPEMDALLAERVRTALRRTGPVRFDPP
jgi:hypothetical protein